MDAVWLLNRCLLVCLYKHICVWLYSPFVTTLQVPSGSKIIACTSSRLATPFLRNSDCTLSCRISSLRICGCSIWPACSDAKQFNATCKSEVSLIRVCSHCKCVATQPQGELLSMCCIIVCLRTSCCADGPVSTVSQGGQAALAVSWAPEAAQLARLTTLAGALQLA